MYLFGLIGLIIGSIIGMLIMKIKIQKNIQKKILQNSILEKKINRINEHQKELGNYFNQNIHLLNTINNNYQELYQDMIQSSNILHTKQNINNIKNNLSQKQNNIKHNNNFMHLDSINHNQLLIKEPQDYPENN